MTKRQYEQGLVSISFFYVCFVFFLEFPLKFVSLPQKATRSSKASITLRITSKLRAKTIQKSKTYLKKKDQKHNTQQKKLQLNFSLAFFSYAKRGRKKHKILINT